MSDSHRGSAGSTKATLTGLFDRRVQRCRVCRRLRRVNEAPNEVQRAASGIAGLANRSTSSAAATRSVRPSPCRRPSERSESRSRPEARRPSAAGRAPCNSRTDRWRFARRTTVVRGTPTCPPHRLTGPVAHPARTSHGRQNWIWSGVSSPASLDRQARAWHQATPSPSLDRRTNHSISSATGTVRPSPCRRSRERSQSRSRRVMPVPIRSGSDTRQRPRR